MYPHFIFSSQLLLMKPHIPDCPTRVATKLQKIHQRDTYSCRSVQQDRSCKRRHFLLHPNQQSHWRHSTERISVRTTLSTTSVPRLQHSCPFDARAYKAFWRTKYNLYYTNQPLFHWKPVYFQSNTFMRAWISRVRLNTSHQHPEAPRTAAFVSECNLPCSLV